MNKLIKYAIVGAIGYSIGQMTVKYHIVKALLDEEYKKEIERREKEEGAQ